MIAPDATAPRSRSPVGSSGIAVDNLLELPLRQALHVPFPPESWVLHIDPVPSPATALIASVDSVFFELDKENSFENVYRLRLFNSEERTVYARESNLQWAPSSSVWVRPLHCSQDEPEVPAIVLGSYETPGPSSEVFYSVEAVTVPMNKFHGLPQGCLRFRSDESASLGIVESPRSASLAVLDRSGTPAVTPTEEEKSTRKRDTCDKAIGDQGQNTNQATEEDSTSKKLKFTAENQQVESSVGVDRQSNSHMPATATIPTASSNSASSKPVPRVDLDAAEARQTVSPSAEPNSDTIASQKVHHMDSDSASASLKDRARLVSNDKSSTSWEGVAHQMVTQEMHLPMLLHPKDISNLFIGSGGKRHKQLEHLTRCKLQIRGFGRMKMTDREDEPIKLVVSGQRSDVEAAIVRFENIIADDIPSEERETFFFLVAKMNNYCPVKGRAVYRTAPNGKKRKIWMAGVALRPNYKRYSGLFVGRNGSGVKDLEGKTNCRISVVNGHLPHIIICGNSPDATNDCLHRVEYRLGWAEREHGHG